MTIAYSIKRRYCLTLSKYIWIMLYDNKRKSRSLNLNHICDAKGLHKCMACMSRPWLCSLPTQGEDTRDFLVLVSVLRRKCDISMGPVLLDAPFSEHCLCPLNASVQMLFLYSCSHCDCRPCHHQELARLFTIRSKLGLNSAPSKPSLQLARQACVLQEPGFNPAQVASNIAEYVSCSCPWLTLPLPHPLPPHPRRPALFDTNASGSAYPRAESGIAAPLPI